MSRGRKLLIAGLVFAVGFALAWPFRKSTSDKTVELAVAAPNADLRRAQGTTIQQSIPQPRITDQPRQLHTPAPHVAAKMTSIGEAGRPSIASSITSFPKASFDLANHPALAKSPYRPEASPVTPPIPRQGQAPLKGYLPARIKKDPAMARPAYATAGGDLVMEAKQRPSDVRHVVQNSDTLEKLAKRYLGDKRRALEIFDLNRDVLDNPHLLPIDAELRIPPRAPGHAEESTDSPG